MPTAGRRPFAEDFQMLEDSFYVLAARSRHLIETSRDLNRQSLDLRDNALVLRLYCRRFFRTPA